MAGNFIIEAFCLLAIGLVVIALRWVARVITAGFSKLAADDYLMIIAGVCHAEHHSSRLMMFIETRLTVLTGSVRGGNNCCLLRGRKVEGTRQQRHDAGAEGSTSPARCRVPTPSRRVEESAHWLAGVYRSALDIEDMHAHLLLSADVRRCAVFCVIDVTVDMIPVTGYITCGYAFGSALSFLPSPSLPLF